MDPLGTHNLPGQSRHRQAAFFEHPFAIGLDDLGVDHGVWAHANVPDEQPLVDPNLGCGKTDAGRFVHRLEHVVDDLHERTVDVGHVLCFLTKHRVTDHTNVVRSHVLRLASLAPLRSHG